jgi:hypothetical protein
MYIYLRQRWPAAIIYASAGIKWFLLTAPHKEDQLLAGLLRKGTRSQTLFSTSMKQDARCGSKRSHLTSLVAIACWAASAWPARLGWGIMQGKSSLPGSRRVHAGLGRHGRHYGARLTLEEASGTHRQPPKFDVPESDAGFLHR